MPKKRSDRINPEVRANFPQHINTYLQEQIRLADTKAAWVFSILGVATAALSTILSKFSLSEFGTTRIISIMVVSAVLIFLAFKHIVLVMYPRLSKGSNNGMMYFRDIITQSKEEYIQRGLGLGEDGIIKELYTQAYNLSRIVEKKFKELRIAIITTLIALAWIIVAIIIL